MNVKGTLNQIVFIEGPSRYDLTFKSLSNDYSQLYYYVKGQFINISINGTILRRQKPKKNMVSFS
jgi:hypothetical protein